MRKTEIEHPQIGKVVIAKKKGMKSMRIRIGNSNEVVVSTPWFVSNRYVMKFVDEKIEWITKNQVGSQLVLYDGMGLGLHGVLKVAEGAKTFKVKTSTEGVTVCLPDGLKINDFQVQIIDAAIKYLKNETEATVLPRLLELSKRHNYRFHQARVKKLKSRWGSCDQSKNITVNAFLVQLDQELIDYVLLHELAHTTHMNHSSAFWSQVSQTCPEYKKLRKKLRAFRPRLYDRFSSSEL
jgi:predicted metal-dependent hydrolase